MTPGNRDEDRVRKKERHSAKEGLWNEAGKGQATPRKQEARLARNTKREFIRGFLNTMAGKMGSNLGLPHAHLVLKCRNQGPGVAQKGHRKRRTSF